MVYVALIRCKSDRYYLKLYKSIVKQVVSYDWSIWLPLNDILQGFDTPARNEVLHFYLALISVFELSMKEERKFF